MPILHTPDNPHDGPLDLAVIILNFNTRDLLRACLGTALSAAGDLAYGVWVVDNASPDGSGAMVAADFPQVHLIRNPENNGFSAGNNLALRQLGFESEIEGKHGPAVLPRYVLLLNPDTLVPPTAFVEMVRFMDANPNVGVAGPRVRRPDGTLDKACRRSFPTPQVSFYRMVGLSKLFPKSRRFNAYNLDFLPEEDAYPVDSVVGAYMQVRREAVLAAGLLDEAFYMYGEDLDWAKRVKDVGWEVWYNGAVEITHVKEAASRHSGKARIAFYEAMWIFYRKHYQADTNWLLDKMILAGIGAKGGADVARHLWRIRRQA
jgi:hypothetical protein